MNRREEFYAFRLAAEANDIDAVDER